MITNLRFKTCVTLALSALLGLAALPTHAGKLFKWVDDTGQIRYGDRIPPQYAKKKNETLSNQGIVVKTRAAAKTPEQLAEEARQAAQKAEQERIRIEAARKDSILLDTFTNEDERYENSKNLDLTEIYEGEYNSISNFPTTDSPRRN